MTGSGGMSIPEWCRMKSLRMAELWIKGYNRRWRATYDVGRILAQVVAKGYCKHLPDGFPYEMEWDRKEAEDGELAEMSEADKAELLEAMKQSLLNKA